MIWRLELIQNFFFEKCNSIHSTRLKTGVGKVRDGLLNPVRIILSLYCKGTSIYDETVLRGSRMAAVWHETPKFFYVIERIKFSVLIFKRTASEQNPCCRSSLSVSNQRAFIDVFFKQKNERANREKTLNYVPVCGTSDYLTRNKKWAILSYFLNTLLYLRKSNLHLV